MPKEKTPSFVLQLKLNTNAHDEAVLDEQFFKGFIMCNKLVKYARKQLSKLKSDKRYRELLVLRKAGNEVNSELTKVQMSYGLSKYQFEAWIAVQYNKTKGIDSHTGQKISAYVWKAVSDCLYRKGKTIHYKQFDNFLSLESKSNASGIRYKDGKFVWGKLKEGGLSIQPQIRKGDTYAREALTHRIKFCRVVRKSMGKRYHYYLQLVLEGVPPRKYKTKDGRVGVDLGMSTAAIVSKDKCSLTELNPNRKDYSKTIRRLQRKMNRSRRSNNPDCYNDDGTIKNKHPKFKKSKKYKKIQMELKTIRRRIADSSRQSEEILANLILMEHGTTVITEKMNFKALQLKCKEDVINEKTHKHRSRKRYGKSIANNAPSRLLKTIERKLNYENKVIKYVDTWKYKASQFNHSTNEFEKSNLNERTKIVDGHLVQRDLYSAFLMFCAENELNPSVELCHKHFDDFLNNMNAEIISLINNNKKYPSSMGLKEFKFLVA